MILTWFIAFILVCTRMLNLMPAGHLDGSSGWCFPPSHHPPRVSCGPAMEKPTGVGCRAVEPTSALSKGGIGRWGKAFLLPSHHQSCATVMSQSRVRLQPHLLLPVLTWAALQSFYLPFSWFLPQEISTFLLPPPSESELFLAVILWWQDPVFSYEPELEHSSGVISWYKCSAPTVTGTPQELCCVIRLILQVGNKPWGCAPWTALLFPCGASQEPSEHSNCSDTDFLSTGTQARTGSLFHWGWVAARG